MPFGNVNVKYSPCKSVAQLKYAANYMLGKLPEQIREGIIKTIDELYNALGSKTTIALSKQGCRTKRTTKSRLIRNQNPTR
jgi:CheY-specific phosphatase CheX